MATVTDQLFRRNQDGMMETVVPQAQGKAAAISRLLSQGGTPFQKSKRYKKGPFKGLTVDEATARAEVLWENSPDALKQRYANRASGPTTDLAPSERPQVASSTPVPPKAMPVAAPAMELSARQVGVAPASTPAPAPAPAPAQNINDLPTDERMRAQGKVNPRPVAPAKVGQTVATPSPRTNPLTGLPMGYRPGDAVAPPMQPAANASVAAQATAPRTAVKPTPAPTYLQQSGINRPQTVSTGVEARAAAEMRRQASINANPSTANPDDPRKFFTGKRKPLTQLVAARA